ncbi:MAG: MoaD/ThiS family protein [Pseudomonadota bacterium]|nr:MoaD/ThiS family protein [Pseudomonadota bacterium]
MRDDDLPAALSPTVTVVLPRALLNLFPDSTQEVKVSASTVGEMIAGLDHRWPGMRDRLCDSTPRIRRHLNVFVEGRRAGLDTRLPEGARVFVLTAMSGG